MSDQSTSMPAWSPAADRQPERFGVALAGGIAVAVLGVVAWVILADTAHVRTALVGFAVALGAVECFRRWAPRNPAAPAIVVILTVASAVVGLLASQYATLARVAGIGFWKAVDDVPFSKVPKLFTTDTDPITWVIMALSVYTGFRGAMRLRAFALRSQVGPLRPASPDPALQHAAFDDLRAANERSKAQNPTDPTP